jgi:DNA-binding PadR family transcriptional regulator
LTDGGVLEDDIAGPVCREAGCGRTREASSKYCPRHPAGADDDDDQDAAAVLPDGGTEVDGRAVRHDAGEKPASSGGMKRVTVRVPKRLLADLEDAVERGLYPSRSEAIRAGIRSLPTVGPAGLPDQVWYTASGTANQRTLHVDENCSTLEQPQTGELHHAPAAAPPRGSVCNQCGPGITREDLVDTRLMTDGGVATTRERVRSMPDPDLTKFQLRILAILAEEARYGLAVKRALEEYYQEDVNHGRLYPNLDDLEERGYVERSQLDKRTNEYAITDAGRDVLQRELEWYADRLGLAIDYSGGDGA